MTRRSEGLVVSVFAMMLAFVVLSWSLAVSAEAKLPKHMDIFTTNDFPIHRAEFINGNARKNYTKLQIHRIDGLKNLGEELSEGLPNDPKQAQAIALQRMQSGRLNVKRVAQEGADTLELAIRFGINRYPAMVFNQGESVIYGVTNVEEGIAIYLRERRRL